MLPSPNRNLLLAGLVLLTVSHLSSSELASTPAPYEQDSQHSRFSNLNSSSGLDEQERKRKSSRKRVRFSVQLKLPSSKVKQLLNGEDDGQYQRLAKIIAEDIQKVYADQPGDSKSYELQFSSKDARDVKTTSVKETNRKMSKFKRRNGNTRKNLLKNSNVLETQPVGSLTSNDDNLTSLSFSLPPVIEKTKIKRNPRTNLEGIKVRRLNRKLKKKVPKTLELTETESSTRSPDVLAVVGNNTNIDQVTSVKPSLDIKIHINDDGKFGVPRLTRLFRNCLSPSIDRPGDYVILMDLYLEAYSQLVTIFGLFGPVFKFGQDDLQEKIEVLKSLRNKDVLQHADHYTTLQKMFMYEYSGAGVKAEKEGVRENKYLLRGLKFIGLLVDHFRDPDTSRGMGERVKEAYNLTLGQHHPWYVRGAVYLALLTFPSREDTLGKMNVPEDAEGALQLQDLSSAVTAVHGHMLKLYQEYSAPT